MANWNKQEQIETSLERLCLMKHFTLGGRKINNLYSQINWATRQTLGSVQKSSPRGLRFYLHYTGVIDYISDHRRL